MVTTLMKGEYRIRTITCLCGKTVTGRLNPKQTRCSLECYRTGQRPGRKTGSMVACKLCGTPRYAPAYKLKGGEGVFCTKDHADKWRGRNKTSHVCKICQNEFQWSPSRTKSGAYNVTYCSLKCRDADPAKAAQLLEMRVKQQTMGPSSLERAGYALLDDMGVQYLRQHTIGGKFTVDAFVPETGVVIQWDGDYWHGHPVRFPNPDARVRRRMALDISQDAYMVKCGYKVVRVWESELKSSVDAVRARLRASSVLPSRTPSVPASDPPAV